MSQSIQEEHFKEIAAETSNNDELSNYRLAMLKYNSEYGRKFDPMKMLKIWHSSRKLFEMCEYLLNNNIPLSSKLLQSLNIKDVEALINSITNVRIKELSLQSLNPGHDLITIYPVLFRGCHVAELDLNLPLNKLQGRPEDTSYNGNIIHLTNSYEHACGYASANRNRDFSDKRMCIAVYDTAQLAKYGTFEPDINDAKAEMSPIESLQYCKQLRWFNDHEKGQQERLSALICVCGYPDNSSDCSYIIHHCLNEY
ncbi:hypothetical protein BH23THE1_BH23THE1_34030 [soil metagenome]